MAEAVCGSSGDVLEIGFGRGVASDMIQELGVRSHTICECNPSVINRFRQWRSKFPDADIHMFEGLWQDRVADMQQYES